MPITGKEIVIPERKGTAYRIEAFQSNGKIPRLQIILQGVAEDGEDIGPLIFLDPIDVFQRLPNDPQGAQIYMGLLAWVQTVAKEQNKI